MINQISTTVRFGWISAFENRGKIFKVKFGRLKKQKKRKILEIFKKNLDYLNLVWFIHRHKKISIIFSIS